MPRCRRRFRLTRGHFDVAQAVDFSTETPRGMPGWALWALSLYAWTPAWLIWAMMVAPYRRASRRSLGVATVGREVEAPSPSFGLPDRKAPPTFPCCSTS